MSNKMFHPKQLNKLKQVFPEHQIKAEDTLQNIYFRAGQASVVRYVQDNTATDHTQNYTPIPSGTHSDG